MKSRYRCLYSKYEPVAAQDWRQLVWLCPMVTKPPLLQEIRLLQESYLVKQREALSLILTSRRRGHGSAWGLWLRRSSPCCWWSYSEVCQKKGQMNQSVTTYNLKMQSRLSNRRWWMLWKLSSITSCLEGTDWSESRVWLTVKASARAIVPLSPSWLLLRLQTKTKIDWTH